MFCPAGRAGGSQHDPGRGRTPQAALSVVQSKSGRHAPRPSTLLLLSRGVLGCPLAFFLRGGLGLLLVSALGVIALRHDPHLALTCLILMLSLLLYVFEADKA